MELTGKRALITGGARGLGYAMAQLFIARGAKVAIADLDEAATKAAAATLGENAIGLRMDVTNPQDVQDGIAATVAAFGGIDVLVNNAGIEVTMPLTATPDDVFAKVHDVNVKGTFYGIKYVVPAMVASGGGAIINLSSIAGLSGVPTQIAYSSSKGAVLQLTRVASAELRGSGIRVNSICPGIIQTKMVEALTADMKNILGADLNEVVTQAQGRMGTPEDIAEVAAFLASDDASFVTGSAYVVDNGLVASTL